MTKKLPLIGFVLSLAILATTVSGAFTASVASTDPSALPACEWDESVFPMPPASALQADGKTVTTAEVWAKRYHDNVRAVTVAHLQPPGATLSCEKSPVRMASAPLEALAKTLPPWFDRDFSANPLPEAEMGGVLLEYLRVYECSLRQRWFLLPTTIATEAAGLVGINAVSTGILGPISGGQQLLSLPDLVARLEHEQRAIEGELAIAGDALHRTLATLAGNERLEPLSGTMECLARASLDISASMGLTAAGASCMASRTWDTHGSLLSLPTL